MASVIIRNKPCSHLASGKTKDDAPIVHPTCLQRRRQFGRGIFVQGKQTDTDLDPTRALERAREEADRIDTGSHHVDPEAAVAAALRQCCKVGRSIRSDCSFDADAAIRTFTHDDGLCLTPARAPPSTLISDPVVKDDSSEAR